MACEADTHFTESESSDDDFQDSGSRKMLTCKVLKGSCNPEDEGPFGSSLGEKPPRKLLEWETVETYNLKDIDDNDLTKSLQQHARDFMRVGGLKFPAGMKQKDTSLEHWKLQSKKLQSVDKSTMVPFTF